MQLCKAGPGHRQNTPPTHTTHAGRQMQHLEALACAHARKASRAGAASSQGATALLAAPRSLHVRRRRTPLFATVSPKTTFFVGGLGAPTRLKSSQGERKGPNMRLVTGEPPARQAPGGRRQKRHFLQLAHPKKTRFLFFLLCTAQRRQLGSCPQKEVSNEASKSSCAGSPHSKTQLFEGGRGGWPFSAGGAWR